MAKWEKMDRKAWENSEVFKEYESILIRALLDMDNKIEAQQQDLVKKLDTIDKSVDTTSKKVDTFLDKTKNLAKDKDKDKVEEEPELDLEPKEPTKEEQAHAKQMLLQELQQLVAEAISKSDYKMAYKIERAMTEISEE